MDYQGGIMTSWNQFCFTGGYIEVAVMFPSLGGIAGLWPVVWAMGNLGRARYGAGFEGMVSYTWNGMPPKADSLLYSGRTPMTCATLGLFLTKHGRTSQTSRPIQATDTTWVASRIFLANGCRIAPVLVRNTMGLRTMMGRSWGGLLLKSILSMPQPTETSLRFLSLASEDRSMRAASGSTRRKISLFPFRPDNYRAELVH